MTALDIDLDSPLIDGVEDREAWLRYRDATLQAYRPADPFEVELAETIARLSWRLRRVGRLEADALADGFVRQNEGAAGSPGRGKAGACERVLAFFCRYEGRLERSRDRAVKELRALQQARRDAGPAASVPATVPPASTIPGPDGGPLASFGQTAESSAGDGASVGPDPAGALASFGQTTGAVASGVEEPQGVASFGQNEEPAISSPVPVCTGPAGDVASFGPTPAGAVASFGQTASVAGLGAPAAVPARARTRASGRPARRTSPVPLPRQPEYVEEGAEEDEWTYSSYKAYWAERDAAERAARLGLPMPSNPDLETIDEPGA